MTTVESPRRRRTRSRRARVLWAALVLGTLVAMFMLGIAFAQTLDDRPAAGADVTDVRTLTPLPQGAPVRTVTVTVTETGP